MIIFHITTPEAWQKAKNLGKYQTKSLETEGFIHCSTQSQILTIANTFYANYTQLILLKIDVDQLISEVKWESPNHPNSIIKHDINHREQFPHVYGVINLKAIIESILLTKNSIDSQFVWNT